MQQIYKYPRTRHIEGSRVQPGDENLEAVPFATLAGKPLVVEEKMDGANAAIRFDPQGRLLLQSRGHYLTGGPRERHFDLFKQWAQTHAWALWEALGPRYVLYGEWLYARHTVFYDALPHYFLEFDILDTERGVFLSTPRRMELLSSVPAVRSVHVLHAGPVASLEELARFVGPSRFIRTGHLRRLREAAEARGLDAERVLRESDPTEDMEGLYIKVEDTAAGVVTERFKFVRASFLTAVLNAEGHWLNRPIVPNQLAPGAEV